MRCRFFVSSSMAKVEGISDIFGDLSTTTFRPLSFSLPLVPAFTMMGISR